MLVYKLFTTPVNSLVSSILYALAKSLKAEHTSSSAACTVFQHLSHRISPPSCSKAISFTSIFVDDKSKRIFFDIKEGEIEISGENTDFGDSRQTISCEYSGPEMHITFNSSLLHIPVKKIDSEFMKMMFRSESAALIISPEPDKDYMYVLMPMQN